ncbi:Chromosome partition protein Smc [Slackia heliotrinireducens]|uniref:Chromosome partition protein Smc n=1 Tax=Slackia heliotrinireducens (strain ATCC 29202 / DSM 20476 / NCTC 11029 / RHS 1) TaxID=471855 RepID=C7N560_SLAHD|nr:chromosome segregation protein SMC [Slackia heliotrinireducens]ACV22045.1 chromosome segregation protein SMC [Slackia heliotrinireducens DSM 20476]VEG99993.1 Chromosome partition protein Smc [Slackia heliotrinireducens]
MYLKSLVLKGFKSFADRQVISLEPGITAIVGPNGSGKSNISDAVLWVLGERNPKHLRGQAMEDVIFAGSSARKSVGVAEVELVLDNSDGTLPVDYAEVSLTRRMYRSGESEYLINGAPARRMDFMDILHDTGLGTGTHSIIGQGNLDAILSSKPIDRRALIEEAAGVLKHKQRKERSARKLASMDNHLLRVKDVAAEVERQLKPLARKAKRAEAYQGLSSELAQLNLLLAVDDLRRLQRAWDGALKEETEAAALIDVKRFELEQSNEKLEKLQVMLQEKGLYVGDLTERRGRFHMVVERIDSADMILSEKARSIASRLENARNTSSGSARRIGLLSDEVDELSARLDAEVAKRDTLETETKELESRVAVLRANLSAFDTQAGEVQTRLRTCERDIEKKNAALVKMQESAASATARRTMLTERRAEVLQDLERAKAELDTHCQGIDAQAAEIEKLTEDSRKAALEADAADRAVKVARQERKDARDALQSLQGEIRALKQVVRSMQTKSEASELMSRQGFELDGDAKSLASLMRVRDGLEPLVERLLGDDVASLFVHDADTARNLVSDVNAAGLNGEASVLFPGAQGRHADGARLLDRIDADADVMGALESLIGDVVVVDTVDEAFAGSAEAGVRYLTRDGVLVWPGSKARVLGRVEEGEGMLAYERRIAELEGKVGGLEAAVASAEAALTAADEDLERKQAMSLDLARTSAQKKGDHASAQAERGRLAARVGTLEANLQSLGTELAAVESKLSDSDPQIADAQAALAILRAERDELQSKSAESQSQRAALSDDVQQASSKASESKLAFATSKERVSSLIREHGERRRDLDRARRACERADGDIRLLSAAEARIAPLHAIFASLRESAQAYVDDLAGKAALEQSSSAGLNDAIGAARTASRDAQKQLDDATQRLNDIRVSKGKLEVQVEAAITTIVDECGVPLDVALETAEPEDRATAESRAFELRRKIERMGTIDSSAAEEYEAMNERYEYLSSQIEDMEAARRSLMRIIDAIDDRMQEQFNATFEAVNANFSDIFARLFPGGSGSLELVDTGEGSPQGVEVNAQPRGKRLTKMMLMSGGEKSLTALALLFAVYKIRSTPFYILDEAEAALDDSNLRRLTAYLEALRHETQLILITHQRRTMEMSDVLYGVSMQSDGVTKVVSQKLDRALAESKR